MISVKMNLDIRQQETKLMGNFTTRQVIALGLGAAYAVPIAFLLPISDIVTKIIIGLALAAPTVACGWVHKDGQYFEVLAVRYVVKKFLTPQYRGRKSSMLTEERKKIEKANDREREKEFIKTLSKKEKKAFLKQKKKGITVQYSKNKEDKLYK